MRKNLRLILLLTAITCVPLVVALIALTRTHWSPVLDLAMTELRVRDVGTRHTPLVGLPGRIGTIPNQGSHPGPISFYLLAPVYRVLGETSWSLELGTALIHIVTVAFVLVLAFRRGGRRMVIAAGVLVAVVLRGYGANVLTQPWNPYLPVVPWLLVLFAAWSLLEGDSVAVLAFVIAGSICAQTHVPYVGLVGGMGVLLLGWLLVRGRVGQAVEMPNIRRWTLISVGVGVILWLPPVVDQLRHTPGNLSMLSDYFRNPPEQNVGVGEGVKLLLRQLNVFRLIGGAFRHSDYFKVASFDLTGSVLPGLLFLAIWIAAAVTAYRMRYRLLIHLHAVIGVSFLLAVVAMARIFGKVWYYLTFWAWGIVALATFAVVWTVVARLRQVAPEWLPRTDRMFVVGSSTLLGLSTLAFSYSAAHLKPPENHLSRPLGAVVGPTATALTDGTGAADGKAGTYIVTWSDVAYFGSQAYGLVNELDRRGFHVGMSDYQHVPITQQRVIDPATATAEIHLATGAFVDEWKKRADAVEVAFFDPRSASQHARYDSLRTEVIAALMHLHADDLVPTVDTNLFGVETDPRVPPDVQSRIDEMLNLGQPTAVFIVPSSTSGP